MGQTLFVIKPDAIEDHHVGAIISILEKKGIVIKKIKMETLTKKQAEGLSILVKLLEQLILKRRRRVL